MKVFVDEGVFECFFAIWMKVHLTADPNLHIACAVSLLRPI